MNNSNYSYVLEHIAKILDNIEKDLHSIDKSLGKIVSLEEKEKQNEDRN